MKSTIQKWGNSLAIRIPKAFADEVGLESNSSVNLTLENGKLVISRLSKHSYTLEELLDGITPENLHEEIDFGGPVGKEVW